MVWAGFTASESVVTVWYMKDGRHIIVTHRCITYSVICEFRSPGRICIHLRTTSKWLMTLYEMLINALFTYDWQHSHTHVTHLRTTGMYSYSKPLEKHLDGNSVPHSIRTLTALSTDCLDINGSGIFMCLREARLNKNRISRVSCIAVLSCKTSIILVSWMLKYVIIVTKQLYDECYCPITGRET